MSKLYGITATQLIPQSDFVASQNENGGWTAKQSYLMRKTGMDNSAIIAKFQAGASIKTLDPNIESFFEFLALIGVPEISTVEGGYTKISCEFTGFYTANYTPGEENEDVDSSPTYSLRGVLVDAPLTDHHKFRALSSEMKESLGRMMSGAVIYLSSTGDGLGDGLYTEGDSPVRLPVDQQIYASSGDAYEFASRITQGKLTYTSATFEWAKRWQGNTGLTAASLAKLSRIATPPGSPPTPTGDRNWMLSGVNQEQTGSGEYLFQKELVFLLSDRGGHDTFLQDA